MVFRRSVEFRGHVYSLTSSEGWHSANSLIVSNCDCVHIPSSEADYADFTLSGDKYFHSLSEAEQERIFTKSGAQAIRDGADLNQVVNARRGMTQAQVGGRDALLTREGVTRRGLYGSSRAAREAGYDGRNVGRRGYVKNYMERSTKRPRVMPETIYQIAEDRADAIRLLKANGFLI